MNPLGTLDSMSSRLAAAGCDLHRLWRIRRRSVGSDSDCSGHLFAHRRIARRDQHDLCGVSGAHRTASYFEQERRLGAGTAGFLSVDGIGAVLSGSGKLAVKPD